jgi:hypothetical protein
MDGPVACIDKGRGAYMLFVGKSERKRKLGSLNIDGRVIPKQISKK